MMLDNPSVSQDSPAGTLLVTQLARMLEVARSHFDTNFEITKRLVTEASSLLESHLGSQDEEVRLGERGGLARWQINKVREFIDAHLTETIRVSDLSALAKSSPSYFSCAFKRSFGASPHAYVLKRRIKLAVRMMLESEAPLSEIAVNCGFADQAHFSRQFRRAMGHTPSHWRRARASAPFAR